jgi:nucleoside-diphosphate-sugar epimerase
MKVDVPAITSPLVVFGASGFVGSHVRVALSREPAGVTLVSRGPLDRRAGEQVVAGDLTAPAGLTGVLPARAVVINLAFDPRGGHDANLALADGLARVCDAIESPRVVHVSTAMVVGAATDRPVTETTPCHPKTAYQRTKLDVEHRLREHLGSRLVVLRPTAVFGAGGLNLRKLVTDLTTRSWFENYMRACLFGRRPMNLVPVETVAAAVRFAAADAAVPHGQTWLVADDNATENNFRDVERLLRDALGLSPLPLPVMPVPPALLIGVLQATGRLSFDPRTTFSSAALDAAGFSRPVSFAAAIRTFAAAAANVLPPQASQVAR